MPTGVSSGDNYANAPTDLPGFGDIQWESMAGRDTTRAMVGGPAYSDDSGIDNNGFNRIVTGPQAQMPIPGQANSRVTDWRMAINPRGPTMWIMLFSLAAVGLIHARVNLKAGPAHAGGGI
jgi:hypothetical protein